MNDDLLAAWSEEKKGGKGISVKVKMEDVFAKRREVHMGKIKMPEVSNANFTPFIYEDVTKILNNFNNNWLWRHNRQIWLICTNSLGMKC